MFLLGSFEQFRSFSLDQLVRKNLTRYGTDLSRALTSHFNTLKIFSIKNTIDLKKCGNWASFKRWYLLLSNFKLYQGYLSVLGFRCSYVPAFAVTTRYFSDFEKTY